MKPLNTYRVNVTATYTVYVDAADKADAEERAAHEAIPDDYDVTQTEAHFVEEAEAPEGNPKERP